MVLPSVHETRLCIRIAIRAIRYEKEKTGPIHDL